MKSYQFEVFKWVRLPLLVCGLGLLLALGACRLRPAAEGEDLVKQVRSEAGVGRNAAVLRLLYSRVPSTLTPHVASGFQDFEAARIIFEPLATYKPNGDLVPVLAALIPTPENGGVAADGRSVTWKLKPDVRWSDGKPFTAEDVAFTYKFVTDPRVAAVTEKYYANIKSVEAVDPLTVKITFKAPTPSWMLPFTGLNGMVLPKHIYEQALGLNVRGAIAKLQPVGTGPYRFITIADGLWTFAANEQYHNKQPFFKLVELEGGVTPYVAARRVLRDGNADFVHNLQLSIEDRVNLSSGGKGRVVATFGSQVERLMLNFSNPNKPTEEGERSSPDNPHPFLSDVRVRQAIDYAVDREAIVEEIYGNAGELTSQLLPYPVEYADPLVTYEFDPKKASALLDEAGWKDTNNNGIRDKEGKEMSMVFQTPINPVRQQTQEMIQKDLAEVGIDVKIRRVLVDDFFSADPDQTRSINHFYADMQEYNTGSDTPDPAIYMSWWLCDEIASKENNWQKPNNARYCNPEYDKTWEAANKELDPKKRAVLFQQLNTILTEDVAVIPLVRRAVTNGVSDRISGIDPTPWDTSTWDIGTWTLAGVPEETTEKRDKPASEATEEQPETPGQGESPEKSKKPATGSSSPQPDTGKEDSQKAGDASDEKE